VRLPAVGGSVVHITPTLRSPPLKRNLWCLSHRGRPAAWAWWPFAAAPGAASSRLSHAVAARLSCRAPAACIQKFVAETFFENKQELCLSSH